MSANDKDNVLDDNKLDFELLTRRRSRRQSSASGSTTPSSVSADSDSTTTPSPAAAATGPDSELIWPLLLKPVFVGHYITGEIVGLGSYAEVRECVDTRTLERFAMKIIDKALLARQAPQALANQLREIRLLRHFRHANIISMRECLFKGHYVFIILEYCPFNLDQLLAVQPDRRLHLATGRRFFRQLCQALSYLHSLGIVHRDIKPQNILLTNGGQLKLIDFGVSHALSMWDRAGHCTNFEGSPLFQAPEIVAGGRKYDGFKADVWSCGITLFLMLYGSYPFVDDALLGLYDKILAEDFTVPKGPPTCCALTDLLAIMLDKDSSRRAGVERVLKQPWLELSGADSQWDEQRHSEFFDLVIKRHNGKQELSQVHATSQREDMYKSMTVLPYLYQHHFPHLPIRRSRQRGPSATNDSSVVITKINPLTPGDPSPADARQRSASIKSSSSSSATTSPAQDLVEQDDKVEWGTREQYHLMKIPQVRVNRIRHSRRKTRREHQETTRNDRD